MRLPDETRIAGEKTVADWREMKGRLLKARENSKLWKKAFKDFFEKRLATRYFGPIKKIEKLKKNIGEGFAIVTLQCSLIEFLASTLVGKTYRYSRNGKLPLGEFLYSDSRDMFVGFLEKNEPFKSMFAIAETALDFYSNVRCGLLHEARTKGTWKIRVCESATQAIDARGKVVYRNKMQAAFVQFVEWYGQQLAENAGLQAAFIRKFDSLCEE